MLVRGASLHPDRDALVLPGERRTYAELLAGSRRVARGLWGVGVRPRDHVGILIPNSFEFLEALFGTALLGAVSVPINARYRLTEIGYVVRNADLVTVLTSDIVEQHVDFAGVLRETFPALAESPDPTRLRIPEAPRLRSAIMLRGAGQAGLLGRAAFDEHADSVDAHAVDELRHQVRVRDTATILYTSGTTAHPKGCMISHEALTRGAYARVAERLAPGPADVHWSAGPLFHIGSLQVLLGCYATCGTYLTDVHFDAGEALRLMQGEGVTHAWPWFPAVVQDLLGHSGFRPDALRSMRSIMITWPKPLLLHAQEVFPWVKLFAACGMTETAGSYAMTAIDDSKEARASSGGTALRGIEIRVVDPDTGDDVPDGQVGELLVRGYCVMDGYYNDPEKTAAALDERGWLHTQDLYSRMPTGHLVFQGRLKDMLKVGGENVAAVEIESMLSQHPAVKLAEVVGAPDPRLDEVPVAFVELKEGLELEEGELIRFCQGRIASFKVPRAVHVVSSDEWPMSATKIDKGALRRLLQQA
jgi:fatty-acyl-CoA synthase/long-chain acyl-CoA synthetase